MPIALPTIEEYVVNELKRDGYYLCFNRDYNRGVLFRDRTFQSPPSRSTTDDERKSEFIEFMAQNYPEVRLQEVFDNFGAGWLEFPFLGTIALDIKKGDPAYRTLSEKYGDPEDEAIDDQVVFWSMPLDVAKKIHFEKQSIDYDNI